MLTSKFIRLVGCCYYDSRGIKITRVCSDGQCILLASDIRYCRGDKLNIRVVDESFAKISRRYPSSRWEDQPFLFAIRRYEFSGWLVPLNKALLTHFFFSAVGEL